MKYNKLIAELQALKENMTTPNPESLSHSTGNAASRIDDVLVRATEAATGVRDLQDHWSALDTAVKVNTQLIEDFIQYGMINSLLIHGLINIPNIHGYQFAYYIISKINELLSPYLACKIDISHLEYAHILPTKSKKKNVVIVKFSNWW